MTTANNRAFTEDEDYWRTQFKKEDYYQPDSTYNDYRGAYETGHEGYNRYGDRGYAASENDLHADWEKSKGETKLAWDKAKHAVKAAWHRMERAMPGDADNDGR